MCDVCFVQLDILGLPFSRYFKFLKFSFWLCIIAMLMSVPNMILFREGCTYIDIEAEFLVPFQHSEAGRFHDWVNMSHRPMGPATYLDTKRSAAAVSVGNMLLLPDNVTACAAFSSVGISWQLSSAGVGWIVSITAATVGVMLLAAAGWFIRVNAANDLREAWNPYGTVSIEEYSVSVTGLPKFTTREELQGHLEGVRAMLIRCVMCVQL